VGQTEAAVGLSVSFFNVPAGEYRLILEIREEMSSQNALMQTDLELIPGIAAE